MRLSEWRAKAPVREGLGAKTMAVVTPGARRPGRRGGSAGLGPVGRRPGHQVHDLRADDRPASRSCPSGQSRRVGHRATAKIARWSRVQIGDAGRRDRRPAPDDQLPARVVGPPRARRNVADSIGRFALVLLAAIEGRPVAALRRARPTAQLGPRRRPQARAGLSPWPSRPRDRASGRPCQPEDRALSGDRPSSAPATRPPAVAGLTVRRRQPAPRATRDPPVRRDHLRHGRRPRRLGDLVGRGPPGVRGQAGEGLDDRRPRRLHGQELARLGAGHARGARHSTSRSSRSWTRWSTPWSPGSTPRAPR